MKKREMWANRRLQSAIDSINRPPVRHSPQAGRRWSTPGYTDSPFAEIGHPKKRAFLAAYAQTGNKSRAAAMAGIVKQTIYTRQWREDAEFQKALGLAKEMACQVLEDEVTRRAVEGVERPVGWYKGKPGGVVREYSDNLLMFKLKALMPDKYRERAEVRGSIANIDYEKLPDHLLARIAAGEHPLSVLASVEPNANDSHSR